MEGSEPYCSFVERSAEKLAEKRDNTRILLSGLEFFPLNPDFFDIVREGQRQFHLPCERIYDDLLASYTRRRQARDRWIWRPVTRSLRWVVTWLRVITHALFFSMRRKRSLAAARLPIQTAIEADSTRPLTSIVMLSYNRLPYLRNSLAAYLETAAGAPCELIAVDNGSNDGSAEFLREAHRKGQVDKLLLLGANRGISVGYNEGFALADAKARYVMKLDSDIRVLTPGWLGQVVDFLEANRQVGFAAVNQVNEFLLQILPRFRIRGVDVMDYGEWQLGSAMVISKQLMDEIGGFIEDAEMTFVPDDIDYYVRASRKGYRPLYLRDVWVYHQSELDMKDYRHYTTTKPRDASIRLALRLAREYDRGTRLLEVRYEKYEAVPEARPE